MTTQQLTDLKLWKQDQSQPLPASLQNALIEGCLSVLKYSDHARDRFNKVLNSHVLDCKTAMDGEIEFVVYGMSGYYGETFENLLPTQKTVVIQTLLSRTPNGQAVIPFLNVKSKYYNDDCDHPYHHILIKIPQTLDHLLYQEFTESLRVGKTFEEALFTINLIYSQNI